MQLLFLILLSSKARVTRQTTLSTAQGQLRGISRDGYVSYCGIPYASAGNGPGGRFKRGRLAPFWAGIREPRESYCSSRSVVEECLQLDVNTPIGFSLPVLVWVTGGSGHYNPTKLVKEGIIVVIVRHRYGPQGFLCSKEDAIPGNVGLKDVVLALRWVRDNIVAFGGNPNKVVVAGHSFGAAMVESLMLTHMARGLFHGVILQSGTALAPWAFNYDAEERTMLLRMKFNGSRDISDLTKAPAAELTSKAGGLMLPYLPFGICVEKSFKTEERLLSEPPFDVLSRGAVIPVPMIVGYTSNEGYIFASMLQELNTLQRMTKDISFLIPIELQTTKGDISRILKEIDKIYFQGNISLATVFAFHRDAYFVSHIHRSVLFHATSPHPVYYYQFSYSGSIGVAQEAGTNKSGPAHSDELSYLFPEKGQDMPGNDGVVQENLVQLWSNFVKTLKPTPAKTQDVVWNPFNPLDPKLLDINLQLEIIEFPFKKEAQMWEHIYENYYTNRRP